MIGRREFAAAGLTAVAATACRSAAAGETGHAAAHLHVDAAIDVCAAECSDCQRECNSCSSHCAMELKNGHKKHAETLATCQDCADVCSAASQILARGGPFAKLICAACVEACTKCAEACEKFPNDEHMTKCAQQCRDCEKACRNMLA